MAFRGRKIADIYAELHLDRDDAQAALRGIPGALGPDADRAGQELGKKVTDGLARSVEQGAARIAKARRAEVDAANAVTVAELRLNEARQKGNRPASQLLALENALEKAQYRLAESNKAATTAVTRHADAERRLGTELDRIGRDASPNAERAGREIGGKLSQGIHLSIVRNSPLIAAAVGGALTVGAPLLTAGAVALFGGVGAVAAAQSDTVKSAWLGTWQEVKAGAVSDAQVLVPTYVGMAAKIAAGFQEMRPALREAFAESGPLITRFTDSVVNAAQNAMPGLLDSIREGGPVIDGLGNLLESTGTGLSQMFSGLSEHSGASGRALSEVGDALETLLPLAGELLGQGAELAAGVLPAVNTGLGLVLATTRALGPALPMVVAGFGAFKIAQSAGGWIEGLSTRLAGFADKGGLAAGVAGRLSTGLGGVGKIIPGVGIAAGLLGAAMADSEQQTNAWADALNKGGAAAATARREMTEHAHAVEEAGSGIGGLANIFLPAASTALGIYSDDVDEANRRHREWLASLTPVESAQRNLDIATRALAEGLGDQSTSEAELARLHANVASATRALAAEQDDLERATRGVTEAMVAQADAARARVDATFAYQDAVEGNLDAIDRLAEAQAELADVQAHLHDADETTRTSQEDVARAMEAVSDAATDVQRSYRDMANAAGDAAMADLPATFDEQQRAILGAKGSLDELNRIIATGVKLPPTLEEYRQSLERITGQADGAMLAQAQLAAAVGELGFAVESVPGEKSIIIDAPTDELRQRLEDLGFTVTDLPDGDIEVQADTQGAMDKLGSLSTELVDLDSQTPTPAVSLNDNAFTQAYNAAQANVARLNSQRPTPIAGLNSVPFFGGALAMQTRMNTLNALRASPLAWLVANTSGAEGQLNYASRNRTSYVTQYVQQVLSSIPLFHADGGPVYAAAGRKVSGPGGPREDRVPAIGPAGQPYRVSPGEWIVNAMASALNGDAKMQALNDGRARIVMDDRRPRALAGGGPSLPATASPIASAATDKAQGIVVQGNLVLQIPGAYNLGNGTDRMRLLGEIRDGLRTLDRGLS